MIGTLSSESKSFMFAKFFGILISIRIDKINKCPLISFSFLSFILYEFSIYFMFFILNFNSKFSFLFSKTSLSSYIKTRLNLSILSSFTWTGIILTLFSTKELCRTILPTLFDELTGRAFDVRLLFCLKLVRGNIVLVILCSITFLCCKKVLYP